MNRIGTETVDLLERNVEYHLEVTDVVGEDSAGLSTGQLAITIHCSGCGYLKIGPALRALESEAEGLGAAFYWTLIRSLYRVMRIYDHSDAEAYEENLIEYAQEDDPANRDQYEFPEVEKALPECIRESLKPESDAVLLATGACSPATSHGRYRNWIRHVEAIAKLSRVQARSLRAGRFRRLLRWTSRAGIVDCFRGARRGRRLLRRGEPAHAGRLMRTDIPCGLCARRCG